MTPTRRRSGHRGPRGSWAAGAVKLSLLAIALRGGWAAGGVKLLEFPEALARTTGLIIALLAWSATAPTCTHR